MSDSCIHVCCRLSVKQKSWKGPDGVELKGFRYITSLLSLASPTAPLTSCPLCLHLFPGQFWVPVPLLWARGPVPVLQVLPAGSDQFQWCSGSSRGETQTAQERLQWKGDEALLRSGVFLSLTFDLSSRKHESVLVCVWIAPPSGHL